MSAVMNDQPTSAQLVDAFGQRLFGDEWGGPMARLAGVNVRTMSRIRQASREGREYPAARGVLAALLHALRPILADLEPHGR